MSKLYSASRLGWAAFSVLVLVAFPARGETLFEEDYEVTPGDIDSSPPSPTTLDLVAKGWGPSGGCPGYYCPGAIVSMQGHDGTETRALRFRYEEGPSSDSDGTGLEVKLHLECAVNPNSPLCGGGPLGHRDIWVRYYYQTQAVPAETPACTPNCPLESSNNLVATKQHYWKSTGESGGPSWGSFVSNFFWGSKEMAWGYQQATDCAFVGGIFDCPIVYPTGGKVIVDNQWYCIEYHWKGNTLSPTVMADGVYEQFVDGVQTINEQDRKWDDETHQSKMDYVMIYRQSGGFQWRFEDDFVIGTERKIGRAHV
mgnify:CR=1 FL=1